jgi:REP element-mobilizing transposase RayT
MNQITNPSRKMLDHVTPVWAESDAEYFITVCCRDRGKNTLAFPHVAKIIFDAVQAYEQRKLWFVRFMLLMPDHLHGIFDFPLDASMQALFANWKRFLSRKHGIHFQRDFFDHRLRSDESFVQKVEYIRYNPVRAGLVSEPEGWPYVYCHDDWLLAGQG